MKRALVYWNEFKPPYGGGELLPLLLIAELQKTHRVMLALDWPCDVEQASKTLGIPVDTSRLDVTVIKSGRQNGLRQLDAVIPYWRTRALQKLAKDADVCLSTANIFDFGKPAHHFIYLLGQMGDNAFLDFLAHRPAPSGLSRVRRRFRTFFAETFLRPILGLRSTRRILADPRERIYPNSRWVADTMQTFFGPFNSTVFYPPTLFSPSSPPPPIPRDPLLVICLGRVVPEKRLGDVIAIVERARALSGLDFRLGFVGGHVDPAFYSSLIRMADGRPWLDFNGAFYGNGKEACLFYGTYAIHAERDESFGIAVTEYLKAGIIPVVPDEGGTAEIVDDPDLAYRDFDEAARLLVRLATDKDFHEAKLRRCTERAAFFAREAYLRRQRQLLDDILDWTPGPVSPRSGLAGVSERGKATAPR